MAARPPTVVSRPIATETGLLLLDLEVTVVVPTYHASVRGEVHAAQAVIPAGVGEKARGFDASRCALGAQYVVLG